MVLYYDVLQYTVMSIRLVEVLSSALHEQSNDETKETKDRTEDLNNENLDEAAHLLA